MNEEIKKYIDQAVSTAITNHRHSGTDSMQIIGSSIRSAPQPTISKPTVVGTATDGTARTAINSIIVALQNLKLIQ